jgi:hypothetical protein
MTVTVFGCHSLPIKFARLSPWDLPGGGSDRGSDAKHPQPIEFLWDFTYLCWNLTMNGQGHLHSRSARRVNP